MAVSNHSDVETRLWNSADQLRANSKLKSSEYAVPVLGLIFLRYADHRFGVVEKELKGKSTGRRHRVSKIDYQAKGVLFVPEQARYSRLLNLTEGTDVARQINGAMKAIEDENDQLLGVLPKDYDRLENDTLFALLKTFSKIQMDFDGDVFGRIYEYFLGKFAMADQLTALKKQRKSLGKKLRECEAKFCVGKGKKKKTGTQGAKRGSGRND